MSSDTIGITGGIRISRIPYPYRAMLAICSDLDETPDWNTYWEIVRFLNTTETTSMGPGVGLEVGNSIYFDMPADQFAYWNTDDQGREIVRVLIRSGHIDCLHSYGDWATARSHAGRALDELARHDCKLDVWIDHSKAITNFGADIMHGCGDVPGSPAYHADLTCAYGIKYVWRGRVTSVVGQDVRASLRGVFTARHPFASARTVAKEAIKRQLAARGSHKYAMHGPNQVLRTTRLRDGRPVYEFLRSDGGFWGGVGEAASASGLAEVLTENFVDRLAQVGGASVFYTHLGKRPGSGTVLPGRTCTALRRFAERCRRNAVLVTTTQRLLGYLAARDGLRYRTEQAGPGLRVVLESIQGHDGRPVPITATALAGITFAVPDEGATLVRGCDGMPLPGRVVRNGTNAFLQVPWERLPSPAVA